MKLSCGSPFNLTLSFRKSTSSSSASYIFLFFVVGLTQENLLSFFFLINPINPELNSICYLLALLAHHFLHISRIRVKLLTVRLLMSYIYIYIYIYGAYILDVSRSHTTTQHSRKDSSGRVISSSQRPLPDNTRHSQQTNFHAPGGIRTHDLSR